MEVVTGYSSRFHVKFYILRYLMYCVTQTLYEDDLLEGWKVWATPQEWNVCKVLCLNFFDQNNVEYFVEEKRGLDREIRDRLLMVVRSSLLSEAQATPWSLVFWFKFSGFLPRFKIIMNHRASWTTVFSDHHVLWGEKGKKPSSSHYVSCSSSWTPFFVIIILIIIYFGCTSRNMYLEHSSKWLVLSLSLSWIYVQNGAHLLTFLSCKHIIFSRSTDTTGWPKYCGEKTSDKTDEEGTRQGLKTRGKRWKPPASRSLPQRQGLYQNVRQERFTWKKKSFNWSLQSLSQFFKYKWLIITGYSGKRETFFATEDHSCGG